MNTKEKSIFNQQYRNFIASMVQQRKAIHMTQRELAKRLGVAHCYVARIETRERRIDLVESIAMMRELKFSDEQIIEEIKKLM